jgi:hypothetical protein
MFIDTKVTRKIKAPEERNVVSDDSRREHSAPPELRRLYGPSDYKHFVPPGLIPEPPGLNRGQ